MFVTCTMPPPFSTLPPPFHITTLNILLTLVFGHCVHHKLPYIICICVQFYMTLYLETTST